MCKPLIKIVMFIILLKIASNLKYERRLRAVLTMYGKVSVNANRLITDFFTGRIWQVKCRLTLTGHCKNGPKA